MRRVILISSLLVIYPLAEAQFKQGFIINQYGDQYPGFLKIKKPPLALTEDGSKILLYKETKSSKAEEITLNELKAFQIENDSFLIIKNYQIPIEDFKLNGFARVILNGTKNILCTFVEFRESKFGAPSTTFGTPSTRNFKKIKHYLLYNKGKFDLITDYNFYNEMPSIVSQNKELKNKIISKKLKFNDIEQIAFEYEQWRRGEKKLE